MKSLRYVFLLLSVMMLLTQGCTQKANDKSLSSVPKWSKEAIWYQIFVERFRNGDTTNDPTPAI